MSKKYDLQRIKLNKIKSNLQSYIQLINFTILTERADNVQLKKQAIKSEAITFKKQKDDIKNEKNVIVQENRKIKQEINIWQDKHHNLVKCAAETEPKVEANKDLANESDERLNGLKIDQKKEEELYLKTQGRFMILVNLHNLLLQDKVFLFFISPLLNQYRQGQCTLKKIILYPISQTYEANSLGQDLQNF
ncbi:unnamed protein product [Paramecium pentaurelia]|uniref:Uncharacterized protein n=1 Tax=Paramecium pentaurelia TaxID=43138 RepID=A0A8S1SRV3_9CILI|nr:unnamed protein product [Paramecium pentaurelia]